MAKDIKKLMLTQVHYQPQLGCDICGLGHPTHECQATTKEINAVENFNRGNFYRGNYQGGGNFNSMGQRHRGFSWSSSTGSLNPWQQQNPKAPVQGPPRFQTQQRQPYQPPQPNNSSLGDLMKVFKNKFDEKLKTQRTAIREQGTAIQNLENKWGSLQHCCQKGRRGLCRQTKKNPKETIKAMSLRSGKTLAEPKAKPKDEKEINLTKIVEEQKTGESLPKENVSNTDVDKQNVNNAFEKSKHMELLPFPQKMKREKLDKCFGKFLEMLKQLYVNIPFTEVLTQMPAYAKFLKEILSSKRKLEETRVVKLNAHCSAILQNKIPKKCGDPGSFTIPCSFGRKNLTKPCTIQLADQTTIILEGTIDDILVRVDKFVFLVDFIVVDMEVNKEVPLILGSE
ncbi:PREDICTED: uncharacterized protein LOC109244563 [Nicotiana attenuata]|uniref:uncharacterized protein LOC109244563 n=1 Tax=Nicotiana attenuata TaxID=49451 RepID=UPI00090469FC|nr:PREDICTED: uncharacterized protein LOC109244563 [Nicotiana attenuata]